MTRRLAAVLALVALPACSFRNVACGVPPPPSAPADAPAGATGAMGGAAGGGGGTVGITFLGDSLTAGLGLLGDQAFPSRVEAMFHADGYAEVEIVNAGQSGDTSAGALRRVDGVLNADTRILVVALGGNDALRGLTPAETHDNLARLIQLARSRGIAVLLCGMEAPPNLGEDYQTAFREAFLQLVRDFKGTIAYLPFLLEGVAGQPALNQPDGIHPNEQGARMVAELVYPKLRPMVDELR
jgi:acyl-CoA thioesterase-1